MNRLDNTSVTRIFRVTGNFDRFLLDEGEKDE